MLDFGKIILEALIKSSICLQWTTFWGWNVVFFWWFSFVLSFNKFLECYDFTHFFTLDIINQRINKKPEGKNIICVNHYQAALLKVITMKVNKENNNLLAKRASGSGLLENEEINCE